MYTRGLMVLATLSRSQKWRLLRAVFLAAWFVQAALAQGTSTVFRGTWRATSGSRIFSGSWSAEITSQAADKARGAWTVRDPNGRIVLQGQWSALKRAKVWQGQWSATIISRAGGRSSASQPMTGSWEAKVAKSESGTLLDLLARSVENSISGTWQSGAHNGGWTVKALPPQ
jgi:hypothetical protein